MRGLALVLAAMLPLTGLAAEVAIVPAPTSAQWADLASLPDWSGTWVPDLQDQAAQVGSNPVPWKPEVKRQVDYWTNEENAGRPRSLWLNCLPHGMPSLMLISRYAHEFLFTPGRVTLLGDSDSNRVRRIWTDGRTMPADPDPTFHGYSIGHWAGDTLEVETRGILPQVYLATGNGVGIPIGADAAIHERLHLIAPDTLADDLTITAPHILTAPWQTRRLFHRSRRRDYEVSEGICRQGDFEESQDRWGNAIYVPTHRPYDDVQPSAKPSP